MVFFHYGFLQVLFKLIIYKYQFKFNIYLELNLLQKGIKKDIIEEKLQVLENSNYERELVEKLLNGKLKNMEDIVVELSTYHLIL